MSVCPPFLLQGLEERFNPEQKNYYVGFFCIYIQSILIQCLANTSKCQEMSVPSLLCARLLDS